MGLGKVKSHASSAELALTDQSPGAGSVACGRRQPLPRLIWLVWKRCEGRAGRPHWAGHTTGHSE